MKDTFSRSITTTIGEIKIFWNQRGNVPRILRIVVPGDVEETGISRPRTVTEPDKSDHGEIDHFCVKIRDFLNGHSVQFSTEEIDMCSCSSFQRQVLCKAWQIPRGQVQSYGHLARAIRIPKGARAVGAALSRNPFPLLIPCHRIVRATGEIGGFGSGVKLKKLLLQREGITFDLNGRVSRTCFLDETVTFLSHPVW